MILLRKLLYSLLGKKLYFRFVSRTFMIMYRIGILAISRKFKTHYLVKRLIRVDDIIIDIGANLGYYTSIFAKASGRRGKVYAVEPVKQYREILASNTRNYSNIEILPYALSDREGESLMSIPSDDKFRHGLTRIMDSSEQTDNDNEYKVLTKIPDTLFSDLPALDYIKCDIEGHEERVIPGFKKLIEKHHPIIQIEIEKSNFKTINDLITGLNYESYIVSGNYLIRFDSTKEISSDIIYIPEKRINRIKHLLT